MLKQRDLKHPAAAGVSRFGLDVSRFGKHPKGRKIDETSFVTDSPTVVEIHLPALLAANREFVVEGKIDPATVGSGLVQLQVLSTPPKNSAQMAGCAGAGEFARPGPRSHGAIARGIPPDVSTDAMLRAHRAGRSGWNHACGCFAATMSRSAA